MTNRQMRKHTERNLLSKKKRWLRNRGMQSQSKVGKGFWKRIFSFGQDAVKNIPLRGIKADVQPVKAATPKKMGFFRRLFGSKGRGK
jgi:hypothetical protein